MKIDRDDIKSAFWIAPYLLGLILISYLGNFGGKGMIAFGWDFLVIGIFSFVILFLAVHTRAALSSHEVTEFLLSESPLAIETH